MLHESEDRRMLDAGGDDLVTAILGRERRQNGRVVGLRAARGEHDLVVECRAQQHLQLLPRQFHRFRDLRAESVCRRCISELVGKIRQHRRHDSRVGACGRIAIEIDRPHAKPSFRGVSVLHLRSAGDRDETHELTQPFHDAGLNAFEGGAAQLAENASPRELDHDFVACDLDELAVTAITAEVWANLLDHRLDDLDTIRSRGHQWFRLRGRQLFRMF